MTEASTITSASNGHHETVGELAVEPREKTRRKPPTPHHHIGGRILAILEANRGVPMDVRAIAELITDDRFPVDASKVRNSLRQAHEDRPGQRKWPRLLDTVPTDMNEYVWMLPALPPPPPPPPAVAANAGGAGRVEQDIIGVEQRIHYGDGRILRCRWVVGEGSTSVLYPPPTATEAGP